MNQRGNSIDGDRWNLSYRKSTLVFAINNQVGGLADALKVFQEKDVNILHIESRKSRTKNAEYEVLVDLECDNKRVHGLIDTLKQKVVNVLSHDGVGLKKTTSLDRGDTLHTDDGVPWFPKHISELDRSSNRVLMYGAELDADHPGFKDPVYRKRRKMFAEVAFAFKHGQPIPRIDYTDEENKTWKTIYRTLTSMYPTYACKEYNRNFPLLVENCGYCEEHLPQLEDISKYLKERTGFQLRPVAGYLSSRDFLAGLAFRVFHCTQYIRHSSDPFYTPEPDCCHELLGHMPLFLDANFAEFSQEIGLASLGASDDEVQKLSTCYFFTIEFGLCKQNGEMRVFGAGLLSSVGELKHVLSGEAVHKEFEPDETIKAECQITCFQDQYFYTNSFEEAKDKLRKYAKTIKRPFELTYNPYTQTVQVLDTPKQVASATIDVMEKMNVIVSAMEKMQVAI